MRRVTKLFQRSIQAKIAFWSGLCLIATVLIIVLYASGELRRLAVDGATAQASASAQESAIEVHAELEAALSSAYTLAATLAASRDEGVSLSRDETLILLRGVLEANPHYLGVYTLIGARGFRWPGRTLCRRTRP